MQLSVLSGMLFDLIENGKVTANEFAEKYALSPRSVARYISRLRAQLPILVKRGRNGGIYLSECYKLPASWLTQTEYDAMVDALSLAYALQGESRYAQAKHKLLFHQETAISSAVLSGEMQEILCDSETLGAGSALAQTLSLIKTAITEKYLVEIVYEQSARADMKKIQPHLLILRRGIWYLYAFCYTKRQFQLFTVGKIIAILKTDERFQKRPFSQTDVESCFPTPANEYITVRLHIDDMAIERVRERIGVHNLQYLQGKWQAHLRMENTDESILQLLTLGDGVQVLSPEHFREKIARIGKKLVAAHES